MEGVRAYRYRLPDERFIHFAAPLRCFVRGNSLLAPDGHVQEETQHFKSVLRQPGWQARGVLLATDHEVLGYAYAYEKRRRAKGEPAIVVLGELCVHASFNDKGCAALLASVLLEDYKPDHLVATSSDFVSDLRKQESGNMFGSLYTIHETLGDPDIMPTATVQELQGQLNAEG